MVRWGTPRDNRPMPEPVRVAANLALAGFYVVRWHTARVARAVVRFAVGR